MTRRYTDVAFTDTVKETQTRYGTRRNAQKVESWDVDDSHFSQREADFIGQRDSFYMASVGDDGWPYVQFRGGPEGFLKVLSDTQLGYADFRGNLQYISMGNGGGSTRSRDARRSVHRGLAREQGRRRRLQRRGELRLRDRSHPRREEGMEPEDLLERQRP